RQFGLPGRHQPPRGLDVLFTAHQQRRRSWFQDLRAPEHCTRQISHLHNRSENMKQVQVTKTIAEQRLDAAGHKNPAEQLRRWRNKRGNNWGWDGWVRGEYPALVSVVWSEESRSL